MKLLREMDGKWLRVMVWLASRERRSNPLRNATENDEFASQILREEKGRDHE